MSRSGGPARVLFVINSLARGGAETQLLGVVREVTAAGHEVVVATLLPENDFADEYAALGVEVWSPPAGRGWSPGWMLRLVPRMRRWRPDVVVSFLFQATLYARGTDVVVRPTRSVSSMRNEQLESRLRSVLYRLSCRVDDCVVVNSRSAELTLRRSGTLAPSATSRVVYNGLDADGVRARVRVDPATTRTALGVAEGQRLVVGVGRLSAQKDWSVLVRATAHAGPTGPRVVVAGEGEQREQLEQLAAELGVSDRFTLLGLRKDVPDLMSAADAVVLSSRYEGTPNVVLEALALGVPVLATDTGACRELLTRAGDVVVPVGDDVALGRALGELEPRTAAPVVGDDDVAAFAWSRIGAEWLQVLGLDRRTGAR